MTGCLSRERLLAYLTDSLSVDEMSEAVDHLNSCNGCQDALNLEADDPSFRHEFLDKYASLRMATAPRNGPVNDLSTPLADRSQLETVDLTVPRVRPRRLGRYELRRQIAQGGIGEVWEAFDPKLKRPVAIKMVRSDRRTGYRFREGFLEEGQKLASLRHEGIVDVYDFGEHEGQVYIVTELLSGGTLASRRRDSPPGFDEAASIVASVARAAYAAHLAGLVHRDIKPTNIVLDTDGKPRLSDFGLAITTADLELEAPAIIGTVPYMSPEQASGQALDARSDVYSLGVVLYELLTGKLPFLGETVLKTCQKIQVEPLPPPRLIDSSIPERLESICVKSLQKRPEDRYQTAQAFSDDLDEHLQRTRRLLPASDPAAAAASATVAPNVRRNVAGRPNVRTLVLVAGLFAAVWLLWSRSDQQKPFRNASPLPIPLAGMDRTPQASVSVRIVTSPEGARTIVYPLDPRFGLPDGKRRTEAADVSPSLVRLPPGTYLVVVTLPDGRFHEVFRTVPTADAGLPPSYRHRKYEWKGDQIVWPVIEIPQGPPPELLASFQGDPTFAMGVSGNSQIPRHVRKIPPFLLEVQEVTIGDNRRVYQGQLPPSLAELKDDAPEDEYPLSGIWWDDAASYAERVGMRLPTEGEYEFAATMGGTREFPWGDSLEPLHQWPMGPVREPSFDSLDVAGVTVFGLYSNVPEWTSSPAAAYPSLPAAIHPGSYIVRGAPRSVVRGKPVPSEWSAGPRTRVAEYGRALNHTVGFRCARSVRPRVDVDDLEAVIQNAAPRVDDPSDH